MDTLADYEAWKLQQKQQDANAAAFALSADDANPDEAAGAIKLSRDYARETGSIPPPRSVVTEFKPVFQQQIDQMRASSVLYRSPMLAEWLRAPDNAAVAKDDLEPLSTLEALGNSLTRGVQESGRAFDAYNMNLFTQRYQDRDRTFSEIMDDQVKNKVTPDALVGPSIVDLFYAGGRYLDARYADLFGADDKQNVASWASSIAERDKAIEGAPMPEGAQSFAQSIKPGKTFGETFSNLAQSFYENPLGGLSWMLHQTVEASPQLAAAIGATAATRNPAAGVGVIGGATYAQERYAAIPDFMREKGLDPSKPEDIDKLLADPTILEEANRRGIIRGLIVAGFNTLSAGLGGVEFAKNPIVEGLVQSVQQTLSGAVGEYAAQKASGQKTDFSTVLMSGLAGLATAPFEMLAAGRGMRGQREAAARAERTVEKIGQFSEAAQASKTRERVPEFFRDYAAKALDGTENEHLYVPAEKFVEFMQGMRVDPMEFLDAFSEIGEPELRTALLTGGDLKIPMADIVTHVAGTDFEKFFAENGRFNPDDMSAADAKAFNEKAQEALQEAYALAEDARIREEGLRSVEQKIYDEMVGRLRAAGRATDVATNEVYLYPAFYRVMAERSGMSVEDMLARLPLPIVEGYRPSPLQAKTVDGISLAIAEARSVKLAPKDKRQTLSDFVKAYGGVNDAGGDLKAAGLEKLTRKGKAKGQGDMLGAADAGKKFGIDDVAMAAMDAGFLDDHPLVREFKAAMEEGRPAPDIGRALVDALVGETRGEARYSSKPSREVEQAQRVAELEQYLAELGVSLNDSDEAIRKAVEADWARQGASYEQQARGSIQFPLAGIGNGETVINLYKAANLSTFAHETGHYFLAAMRSMADGGFESARQDLDVVRGWWAENADAVAMDARKVFGGDVKGDDVRAWLERGTSGDIAKDAAIDTGVHEQFARAFEQYLMEGRAPSLELKTVFSKFKAWLVAIYKRLGGLGVSPSNELRAVFDRLLATDDEIAKAREAIADEGPMFTTAEEMGVSEEDFAAYLALAEKARADEEGKLLREAMAPVLREREEWYREEIAKTRAEVEKEMRAEPVYRATQELRFGRDFDGAEIIPVKLDRAAIERDFDPGYIPLLPGSTKDGAGHRYAVYANEGGFHPDAVAELYGFADGRALLDALSKAQPIGKAIDAETELRMRERHGDPLNDGSIELAALDAVHGDMKGQVLAAELKALVQLAGSDRGLTHKQARAAAKDLLITRKVKDVQGNRRFLVAERKAAQEAIKLTASVTRSRFYADASRRKVGVEIRGAVRRQDTSAAPRVERAVDRTNDTAASFNEGMGKLIEAKRRQLLNHMLYDEALKASKQIEKLVDKLSKLDRPDKKLGKYRDIDFVKGARAIAARFGLARGDEAFDFAAWAEQLKFDDPVTHAAIADAISTYSEGAVKFRDLTLGEFEALNDAIENILAVGKRARELEIEGKRVDRETAIGEMTAILEARGINDNPAMKRNLTKWEKTKNQILSIKSALTRMEAWARDMDDGKQGVFHRYMVKPIFEATGIYRAERAARLADLLAIIDQDKARWFGSKIAAPELGGYTFENKGQLLHAILHTGNDSNREKLLNGWGWTDGMIDQKQKVTPTGKLSFDKSGNPIMDAGRLDTSRWDSFINRMHKEGILTKADWDAAQKIWDLMEKLKRPAQSTHRRLYGYYFREIEPKPIVTPFGTYKGGYVPAIADRDASFDAQFRANDEALSENKNSFMFPTTSKGFTKSRVQNYSTPLKLDITMLPAHMDKVLRFTHLQPVISQTASLVTNREFRDTLTSYDRHVIDGMIVPWLTRVASQQVEAQAATMRWQNSKFWRTLRNRSGIHLMFANISNTLQQVTGVFPAMTLVSPGRMKSSMIRFAMAGAGEMRAEALAASKFMKDRIDNATRDTQRHIEELVTEPTIFGKIDSLTQKHGYFMQTIMQNFMDVIVWHAALDQARAKGMDDAAAVFEADSVIRRTQGDFGPENLSNFEAQSSFVRLFTMFYSYFNGQANLVGGEMKTAMRNYGWHGSPRLFWLYMMGIALPAIVSDGIAKGMKGDLGDADDDGYGDDLLDLFVGSQFRYMTAMVPGVGTLTNAVLNRFNSKYYDDRITTSPVLSTLEQAAAFPADLYKLFGDKPNPKAAVTDGLTAFSLITGIPTGQLAKLARYAMEDDGN